MTRKSAAPLTPDLLARKGEAGAAPWRTDSVPEKAGDGVVTLAGRGAENVHPSAERPEKSASEFLVSVRLTRRRLLAFGALFAVTAGLAGYLAIAPQPEPAPPATAETPTDIGPAATAALPQDVPADTVSLQVASGPATVTREAAETSPPLAVPEAPDGSDVAGTSAGPTGGVSQETAPPPETPVQAPEPAANVAPAAPPANDALPEKAGLHVAATPDTPPAPPVSAAPVPAQPPARPKTAALTTPVKPDPAATSRYQVQVASVKTRDAAEREWGRLQAKFAAILSGREPVITRAALGQRGIFFRLRTGGFATRGEATGLCRRLQAAGQACLVVRR